MISSEYSMEVTDQEVELEGMSFQYQEKNDVSVPFLLDDLIKNQSADRLPPLGRITREALTLDIAELVKTTDVLHLPTNEERCFLLESEAAALKVLIGLSKLLEDLKQARDAKNTVFLHLDRVRMRSSFVESMVQSLSMPEFSHDLKLNNLSLVYVNPDYADKISLHRAYSAELHVGMIYESAKSNTGEFWYIGSFPKHLMVVLNLLIEHGPSTSSDLVNFLPVNTKKSNSNIALADISGRLRDLYTAGIIKRDPSHVGRGIKYYWFDPRNEFKPALSSSSKPYQVYNPSIKKELETF